MVEGKNKKKKIEKNSNYACLSYPKRFTLVTSQPVDGHIAQSAASANERLK